MSPSSRINILLFVGGVVALTLVYYYDAGRGHSVQLVLLLEQEQQRKKQQNQQQQVVQVVVVADDVQNQSNSRSAAPAVGSSISSRRPPIPIPPLTSSSSSSDTSPIPLAVPCLEKLKHSSPAAFSCATTTTITTSKEDGNATTMTQQQQQQQQQQHARAGTISTQFFLTAKDRTGDVEACRARYRETQPPGMPAKQGLLQVLHLQKALREEQERTCGSGSRSSTTTTTTTTTSIHADLFSLVADHKGASTVISDGHCQVGIIFPRSLVSYCACAVWNDVASSNDNDDQQQQQQQQQHLRRRYMDNFFSGTMTPQRQQSWMGRYADRSDSTRIISDSTKRDYFKTTGLYDYEGYYDQLQSTRFALCPDGDFPWTYRFLEAIMCGAIPVVGPRANNRPLDQEVGYTYCVASSTNDRDDDDDDDCDLYRNETARTLAAQANWLHFVQRHSFIEPQEVADLLSTP
jgi:Exostosin family